jgi:hypothetical protein
MSTKISNDLTPPEDRAELIVKIAKERGAKLTRSQSLWLEQAIWTHLKAHAEAEVQRQHERLLEIEQAAMRVCASPLKGTDLHSEMTRALTGLCVAIGPEKFRIEPASKIEPESKAVRRPRPTRRKK